MPVVRICEDATTRLDSTRDPVVILMPAVRETSRETVLVLCAPGQESSDVQRGERVNGPACIASIVGSPVERRDSALPGGSGVDSEFTRHRDDLLLAYTTL